ncbi:hypothetical protein SAMN05216410_1928 [Sanguibacter gelidistatuariae]|uniref:Uncharacterized protein n=1 Tax=Sanguibacter gelidistatuariae TaxID=1814289 RepID=A0A1G6MNX3_9MICO|nr:hypothetical protein [Sanguibacter gelidistatuariae]SDC57171.1 hypothetical protein SAMN05216410_1928 [Sanguibacter gelidistatuariae]
MSVQPHRSGPTRGSGPPSRTAGGILALWGVALTLLVGSLTVAALVVVRGGPQSASASDVVVTAPEISHVEELESGASVVSGEDVAVAPVGWKSVLAPDVGFYHVLDYSIFEFTGHMKPSGAQVMASDETFDVILGEELVSSALVYSVDVADQPADGDQKSAWTVTMQFADAQALADATADLGCQEKPDNMIAVAAGTDLLMLASLEGDEYCGSGFTKGRILWRSFYGDSGNTSEEAKAIADAVAAGLLGTDG